MAQKRMLSQAVIETDKFYMLPTQTQTLYLHLSLLADDDGFVDNARMIARSCGATVNDIDELVNKEFLIKFEDGIYCIAHWRVNNNKIQMDRYRPTLYRKYYEQLIDEQGQIYELTPYVNNPLTEREQTVNSNVNKIDDSVNKPLTTREQNVHEMYTQNRIEKNREEENRVYKNNNVSSSKKANVSKKEIKALLVKNGNNVNKLVIELSNRGSTLSKELTSLIREASEELKA